MTIQPDGEPRARTVRIGDDFRIAGTSRLAGEVRLGNSGSPVFVDGRLTGIATAGLYKAEEDPGEVFEEGVLLRIDAIRRWLARRGLERLLD